MFSKKFFKISSSIVFSSVCCSVGSSFAEGDSLFSFKGTFEEAFRLFGKSVCNFWKKFPHDLEKELSISEELFKSNKEKLFASGNDAFKILINDIEKERNVVEGRLSPPVIRAVNVPLKYNESFYRDLEGTYLNSYDALKQYENSNCNASERNEGSGYNNSSRVSFCPEGDFAKDAPEVFLNNKESIAKDFIKEYVKFVWDCFNKLQNVCQAIVDANFEAISGDYINDFIGLIAMLDEELETYVGSFCVKNVPEYEGFVKKISEKFYGVDSNDRKSVVKNLCNKYVEFVLERFEKHPDKKLKIENILKTVVDDNFKTIRGDLIKGDLNVVLNFVDEKMKVYVRDFSAKCDPKYEEFVKENSEKYYNALFLNSKMYEFCLRFLLDTYLVTNCVSSFTLDDKVVDGDVLSDFLYRLRNERFVSIKTEFEYSVLELDKSFDILKVYFTYYYKKINDYIKEFGEHLSSKCKCESKHKVGAFYFFDMPFSRKAIERRWGNGGIGLCPDRVQHVGAIKLCSEWMVRCPKFFMEVCRFADRVEEFEVDILNAFETHGCDKALEKLRTLADKLNNEDPECLKGEEIYKSLKDEFNKMMIEI